MSLRSEIHAAIDDVAPPAPMLASKAEWFVRAVERDGYAPSHRRPSWFARPMRGTFALVAAALVIALMAGLVMGGRLWRDWSNLPAHTHTINLADLERLRARPVTLPTATPGAECPAGPSRSFPNFHALDLSPVMFGDGPIYTAGNGERYVTQWGTYIQTGYRVDPSFAGLVLVRARDLLTGQWIVFANSNFSGMANASDLVVGADYLLDQTVQQHPEMVIDTTHLPEPVVAGYWQIWGTLQGYAAGGSGCIGFQADGAGFSEVVVVSY